MLRDPAWGETDCAGRRGFHARRWGGGGVPSLGGMRLFDSRCPISHSAAPQKVMDCWARLVWVLRGRERREGLSCL